MSADLLPCPFCGSRVSLIAHEGRHYPGCGDCDYTAEFDTETEAVAWWNTRPSPWIPCSERMPEPQTVCLVSNGKFVAAAYPFMLDRGYAERITHWMPLPEPPEEVGR